MSHEPPDTGAFDVMLKKLLLVLMGFMVLVLFVVAVGYLGNMYYESKEKDKELDLEKQQAWSQGLTFEEYLRLKEDLARGGQEGIESQRQQQQQAAAAAAAAAKAASEQPEEEDAIPETPPLAEGQQVLATPDLSITGADIGAMRGKAALIHTSLGTMVVELYGEDAPVLVKNFLYLVEKGFYEGQYFHRSAPDVFVEAGSPNGRRGGTAGYWVDMVYNELRPNMGTIAMLAAPGTQKMGSEFVLFIADGKSFEGMCSAFGRVIDRFDVVEKIGDSESDSSGYMIERSYISKIEIVDLESVRPAEDFWANYGD